MLAEARFVASGLQPGTNYVVSVTASNAVGQSPPVAARAFSTKPAAPPTLMNLRNSTALANQPAFRLEVGPNGFNTDYRFELARAGESFDVPLGTSNFVAQKEWTAWPAWDTGLPNLAQPGITYKWRVVATNAIGTTISDTIQYTRP